MLASGFPNGAVVPLEEPVSADTSALPAEAAYSDGRNLIARQNSGSSSSLALNNILSPNIPSSPVALKPSGEGQGMEGAKAVNSSGTIRRFNSRVESVQEITCLVDHSDALVRFTFTFAGRAVVALEVPESYQSQAMDYKDRLMSYMQSGTVDPTTVSIFTARLEAIPGAQFRYSEHQPVGDLFLALNDALSWLRPQLFPGCVLGHKGLEAARFPHSEHLALRLCGGEAVYFVARGRDAHEIVAVQVHCDSAGKYKLVGFTGLGGVVASHPSEVTSSISDLSLVVDLLTKVSDGQGTEATIPLSVVVPGDWRMDVRYTEALAHAGRFLTMWKALQEECSPNVLDTPAMIYHGDVLRQSRGRISVLLTSAPAALPSKERIAVFADDGGLDEILFSTGVGNFVGRLSWKQLWVRAIDHDTNPLVSPKHIGVMLRRIFAPEVKDRDALLRPELDPPSAGFIPWLVTKASFLVERISGKKSASSQDFNATLAA